jgi:polar amino acid transport system substrate-binding protein
MSRTSVLILLTVFALLVSACGPAGGQVQPTQAPGAAGDLGGRTLRVGTDATYPPFETVDANQNFVGFDIDMFNAICQRVNCKPDYKVTGFDAIFIGLQQGDLDIGLSGITITDERKQTMDFTDGYLSYGEVVLVRNDETRINGKSDLEGKQYTVGVQLGTTNEETARQVVGDEKIKAFDTFDLAVQALINKDVDAVIIDSLAGYGYMETNPGKMKIAGEPFTSDQLGIAVRKGQNDVVSALNAGLAAIKADGTMKQLCEKWWPQAESRPSC